MRVPDDHPLALTLALRNPDTALAAVEAYRCLVEVGKGSIDPLAELVASDTNAKAAVAALEVIGHIDDPVVPLTMRIAAVSRFGPVRQAAIRWWQQNAPESPDPIVERLLCTDPLWGNRRAALQAIAEQTDDDRWQVLAAADDPHWRVRHALIRVLLSWDTDREEIRWRLRLNPARRAQAVLAFLEYRWTDTESADVSALALPDPAIRCTFWDWDPAVLAAKLNRMTATERRANIDAMPFLVGHDDDRVWKPAVKALRDFGELRHYREAFEWRADPRNGAEPALERLLDGLEEELREELLAVFPMPQNPKPPLIPTQQCATHMKPEWAARILNDPTKEHSWEVIAAACRIAKVPLWEVEPAKQWIPPSVQPAEPSPLSVTLTNESLIPLGPDGLLVSRMGISGHYLLPPEGFAVAAEAGVNWFFWEPNYTTLTDFSRRISDSDRRRFHFVAGTFEAEGKRIRTDVERALRALKVEQLGLFLIFWVQSWDRMTDDLRDTVAKLKAEGKVRSVGFSSHNRPLLVRAMQEGWNPVMARHSAGHRGAETAVFPFVPEGTSLITFNNLCYGRLLQPVAGMAPPAPADCYRYTLGFPQVSACWSAPATLEQLQENLAVLRDPVLSDEKREYLQCFGAALYRDEKVFEKLVRMT